MDVNEFRYYRSDCNQTIYISTSYIEKSVAGSVNIAFVVVYTYCEKEFRKKKEKTIECVNILV
jgi:hypothetical protein